ncbi:MAG TPA: ABC transporter ATP-binding protein [Nitrospiria bacterium]|jgi:multiple sugar transport system ATP-binding protein|nr:ABC transporter ATP-binding protein [Nitrospiria bacterium]
MATISLVHIEKSFGPHKVISNLNLEVEDGQFVVLVGPSGCGKTTTLNMIAGLESISAGSLLIGDQNVTNLPPKHRNIAMVFQSYALFPHLNVRENVAFGMKIRHSPKEEIAEEVAKVTGRLRIKQYLDRLPKALSGGQRQRVALARALVRRPGVFLMDEPLSNLDAQLRVEARSLLAKMHLDLKTTTIYVTHDQAEAMTLGDRVVVMNEGVIQQNAPPLEVYNAPANRFVASFIGSPAMNFFDFRYADGELLDETQNLRIMLPPERLNGLDRFQNKALVVGARPEHIRTAQRLDRQTIRFTIDVAQQLGHETLLDVSNAGKSAVIRVAPTERFSLGETRAFELDLEKIQFFDPETGVNVGRSLPPVSGS